MSPKVLAEKGLIFWFHSHDALHEKRASVHVGKGTQDDVRDAKIWLEPQIKVARTGRTLRDEEMRQALKIAAQHHSYLMEEWHAYKGKRG